MKEAPRFTDNDVALVAEIRDRLPQVFAYVRNANVELDSVEHPCDTITVGAYAITKIEAEVEEHRVFGTRKKTVTQFEVYVETTNYAPSRWEPDDTDLRLVEAGLLTLGDAVKAICLSEMGAVVEAVIDSAHAALEEEEFSRLARRESVGTLLALLGPDARTPDAEAVFDYLLATNAATFDIVNRKFRFTVPVSLADVWAHVRNLAVSEQA